LNVVSLLINMLALQTQLPGFAGDIVSFRLARMLPALPISKVAPLLQWPLQTVGPKLPQKLTASTVSTSLPGSPSCWLALSPGWPAAVRPSLVPAQLWTA
jgi:hypothetical protein